MKDVIISLLKKEVKLKEKEIEQLMETPPSEELGDYAFPCFVFAKTMKRNPLDIAKDLKSRIEKKLPKEIEKLEAKGPYLNFFTNKKILAESIIEKIDKNFGSSSIGKGKKIIIDFSGPNIGKPMHIGHIRSTILGDSLLRTYNFLGYNAIGINYLGDIGLHMGKLIVAYELWLDKEALKKDPVKELLRLYIKFCEKENVEYNEELEEEFQDNEWTNKAKEKLKLLELGEEKTHKIWHEITKYSRTGFDKIYKILNINFHETTGQSMFSEKGKKIISEALKKRGARIEEDGAVYVEFPDLPKKYILRSNQTASYITQDIGAAVERYKKYKFDKMIYVTDFRQELHFRHLFATLKKFGYEFSNKLFHVAFGTINFGNEIMATRKGKVIILEDVLKKTIEKAEKEIKKRKSKGNAEKIGVGAIKYSFLKNEPVKDVNFSWEQALNFEGNTGPYLHYSYARASSIIKKSKKKTSEFKIKNLHKNEIKLLKSLTEFPETVENSSKNLNPALIANYSFELSQIFNEFYHYCPVIGSEEEQQRLAFVQAFRHVLKNSMYLLGIEVMEEM